MTYSIIIEKLSDPSFPNGYYYAHVPTLDLTTHGFGVEGARKAALDLVKLWIEEKKANGEHIPIESDILFSQINVEDAVLST